MAPQTSSPSNRRGSPGVVASFVLPYMPHPLLIPDANPGYRRLRKAYGEVRWRLEEIDPDLILVYSTQWPSVIGHQVQVDPWPEWVHVDQEWHELGSMPYQLRMDPAFGAAYVRAGQARGLEMRGVSYRGFPVDTGTIVCLQLVNADNKWPASVVSSNMYADRAETIVLGKAAQDAIRTTGKRVVAIAVTALSNRLFSAAIPFAQDRIHSRKDDEWNRKYLDFLGRGRLEDASQLAREFAAQAQGDSKLKAIWWLAAVSGAHNRYDGEVLAYEALYGTGAAIVALTPTQKAALDKEYDEDAPEVYRGDRNVLGGTNPFEAADGADGPAAAAPPTEPQIAQMTQIRPKGPSAKSAKSVDRRAVAERDEDDIELWSGAHSSADPDAAAGFPGAASSGERGPRGGQATQVIHAKTAPKPVGAYAHARRVGDLLFVAGIGPRVPADDSIPGGPTRDAKGNPQPYDIRAQTRQCIENVRAVLRESGCDLDDVFDVQVFLTDMKADFKAFNEVYAEYFRDIQATRTTVQVEALPTPIAVELKVIAQIPK